MTLMSVSATPESFFSLSVYLPVSPRSALGVTKLVLFAEDYIIRTGRTIVNKTELYD